MLPVGMGRLPAETPGEIEERLNPDIISSPAAPMVNKSFHLSSILGGPDKLYGYNRELFSFAGQTEEAFRVDYHPIEIPAA